LSHHSTEDNLKSFAVATKRVSSKHVTYIEDTFYFVSAEIIHSAVVYRQLAICFRDNAHVTKVKINLIFPLGLQIQQTSYYFFLEARNLYKFKPKHSCSGKTPDKCTFHGWCL